MYRLLHLDSSRLQAVSTFPSPPPPQREGGWTYGRILASNRDEFLDRPTLPAAWHTFARLDAPTPNGNDEKDRPDSSVREPWVLSGRDEGNVVGGTWLGMTRDLRIAVLYVFLYPSHIERSLC